MIYDTFKNTKLYFGESQALSKALRFAVEFDQSEPDGKYIIEGDNIYALVMTYNTKFADELKFEGHKKYIDIQLLLDGQEFLDVSRDKNLDVETPFSDEKDVALFKPPKRLNSVLLEPGCFAVMTFIAPVGQWKIVNRCLKWL